MTRFILTCFLITAVIVTLCALVPIGFCLFVINAFASCTDPNFNSVQFYSELIALFTTFEGFALFVEMFSGIALVSLYVSIPLSMVVVAIYCLARWMRKRRADIQKKLGENT